ncbi:hypothetical protein [Sphingomonas colocasiae]|uniref:Uncharacterized protein n=1 Tax=Sphingomonas colocasiae TaxID=1848973 RepID=A0ABS7PY65_9SPHN|nr:hypothetical protein [Sphingomonas colocasiae]MBY8826283.1 hypothetical protein [Sphingomonas colocasiae]
MGKGLHPNLNEQFEAAFHYPFTTHDWRTKRGRAKWVDLEDLQDRLAGPIYSVVENGGCAYVYSRDDQYFKGVDEPETLRARLQAWYGELVKGIDDFSPASPAESADAASMRQFANAIWAVAERAHEIERERWNRA